MSNLPTAKAPIFPGSLERRAVGPAAVAPEWTAYGQPSESIVRVYWRILYRWRWLVLASVAACLALAILVSMLTPKEYSSTVRLQIARETAKVIDLKGGGEEPELDAMEFYQTQYALLESRSLSEAVVRDLGLDSNAAFLSGFKDADKSSVMSAPRQARFEKATRLVKAGTTITPIRGSSIVDVQYMSPDPATSAAVANSIAENFIEAALNRRFEAAAYARQFLQNRLNQVRTKLEDSERKAVAYAQREGLIKLRAGNGASAGEQSLLANDLADLSTQLEMARVQRAQAEAAFRSGASGSIAAQSLTHSTVNQLRQQRAELLGQLSKLQSDFGPEYPPVVALRSQIQQLDRQINIESSRVSSSVSQDLGGRYRQAVAAERSIQARVDDLKSRLLNEQGRSIQYNIIQRDVDTNRALYEALLQRFKEVGVAGGVGTNNISVVDSALPAKAPSSPNVPFNLAVGFFAGLLLGIGLALLLEHLRESVITPADFERKLGVPLLGSVPLIQNKDGTGEPEKEAQVVEAYFSVLTAIQFSTSRGTPPVLFVTSSRPGEGKSTTSWMIAQSLATVGGRVLLIDADLRKPSLHRFLGLPLGRGLSEILTNQAELDSVIQQTGQSGLSVMLAGRVPPNPAELLGTAAVPNLLKTLSGMFDHVVIDGPPVLALADAPLLAKSADGTVFVVESASTRSSQARQAIERLRMIRANLIGAVLTKLDSKRVGYGSDYGYHYRYSGE
ncbi:MAG: polysaccharide biosynthesis tyrosine autokinase [Sphingomicrobium sp.]